jgi:hypothetical protein
VLRGIEELATENISYTAEKTGNAYQATILKMAVNAIEYLKTR